MTVIPTTQDYPDFTRLSQFTSSPLIVANTTATFTPKTLGTFYTGGFESLVVATSNQQAGAGWIYTFLWFADQALTQQIGQANLRTLSAIPVNAQIPNRGPWCQVQVTTNLLAPHTFQMLVLPRTGTPTGAGAFLDGAIHLGAGIPIAGATTLTQNAFGLTPGPATLTVTTTAVVWNVQLLAFDELSASTGAFGGLSSTGGVAQSQRIMLPPDWTQLQIRNNDAGNQFFNWSVQADL